MPQLLKVDVQMDDLNLLGKFIIWFFALAIRQDDVYFISEYVGKIVCFGSKHTLNASSNVKRWGTISYSSTHNFTTVYYQPPFSSVHSTSNDR